MLNIEIAFAEVLPQRLSAEARASLLAAERLAGRAGSEIVGAEHLLLALIDPPSIPLRLLFANLRIDMAEIVARLKALIARPEAPVVAVVGFADDVARAIERTAREAAHADDSTIDSRHLLLALLALPETPAATLLQEAGVTDGAVRKQMNVRGQTTAVQPGVRSLLRAIQVSPLFLAIAGLMLLSGALLALVPHFAGTRALIAIFIISGWAVQLCIHEFGHAATAYLGGDESVVAQGYLTLDPRRYSHPLLSIVLPLIFLFLGGLPLPGGAVMINHGALRSRKWQLAVSAAGPLGTLLCLVALSIPFLIAGDTFVYMHGFYLFASASGLGQILAAVLVLNLLPIPPLDGFQILSYWLPDELSARAYRLGWMPMLFLFLVLGQRSPISDAFWSLTFAICHLLQLPLDLGGYALWLIGF
jgi:Zn-dependent protease